MADRHKKVETICKNCERVFSTRQYDLDRGYGLFCSRECSGSWHKPVWLIDKIGEDNHNWKGGIAKDNYHYKKLYQYRHPEKARAHRIAENAVRVGKLIKQPCEVCGATIRIHKHHDDYNKPLEVRWLCRAHHDMFHKGVL